MANTMPPMLQVMKDIGGVELPESLIKINIDKDDLPKPPAPPAEPTTR
jgi:flotillin